MSHLTIVRPDDTRTTILTRLDEDAAEEYAARVMAEAFGRIANHPGWCPEKASDWRDRAYRAERRLPARRR